MKPKTFREWLGGNGWTFEELPKFQFNHAVTDYLDYLAGCVADITPKKMAEEISCGGVALCADKIARKTAKATVTVSGNIKIGEWPKP